MRIRFISVLPVKSWIRIIVAPMVEQAPVLPPVRCLHMLVYPLHLDPGALHGLPPAVHDDPSDPGPCGLHIGKQRLL